MADRGRLDFWSQSGASLREKRWEKPETEKQKKEQDKQQTTAVSYTHLDVYKRQGHRYGNKRQKGSAPLFHKQIHCQKISKVPNNTSKENGHSQRNYKASLKSSSSPFHIRGNCLGNGGLNRAGA